MKIGLEVEFFTTKDHELVNASSFGFPSDEYPLLAEARGLPNTCVFQAVASVRGEIDSMSNAIEAQGCKPVFQNWWPKNEKVEKLHEQILRNGLHKRIDYQNIDSLPVSKKNKKFIAAGLHVSFTSPKTFDYSTTKGGVKTNETFTYNPLFDFPQTFRKIEKEFATEIKDSGRTPGFYEIKADGRIEYRSLPATLIWDKNFAARLKKCLV